MDPSGGNAYVNITVVLQPITSAFLTLSPRICLPTWAESVVFHRAAAGKPIFEIYTGQMRSADGAHKVGIVR